MPDDRDDPDRVAILARRNRLIAVALSGFALAGGCGESDEPPPPPEVQQTGWTQPEIVPCLSPPREEADPLPCLAIAPDEPPPDLAEETPPVPQPCLSVPRQQVPEARPQPPAPQACLSVRPRVDPPRDEAAPRPCLSRIRPSDSFKNDV